MEVIVNIKRPLTIVAQLVECPSAKGTVTGSILARAHVEVAGADERQLIHVSLPHRCLSPSLLLSLKINKIFKK